MTGQTIINERESGPPVNILMVDDRPENLLALAALLSDSGHNLIAANSGIEALRRALADDFALILLDVDMPIMDGFETATRIRERERSRLTPIIFLTAMNRSEMQVFKGYSVGAVDYLFKPFSADILRSKVAVFVELHRKTTALRQQAEELAAVNLKLQEEVAERKRAEVAVRQLNQQLEHRLAETAAANRDLESFSYSISHDLRTPLRHIDGFLALLKKQAGDQLDAPSLRYLNMIATAAQQMGKLIDDLLTFSRLNRAELRRLPIKLEALMQSILAEMRPDLQERQIIWRIGPLPEAIGDLALLRVALVNLIANAVKYTSRREQAEIEIGYLTNEQNETVFFIRDNGAGFEMEYVHKLFGVFQRLHTASEFEGTGVGLAIVHRIINRHGGRIWAQGQVGQGATFYFTLGTQGDNDEGQENIAG